MSPLVSTGLAVSRPLVSLLVSMLHKRCDGDVTLDEKSRVSISRQIYSNFRKGPWTGDLWLIDII